MRHEALGSSRRLRERQTMGLRGSEAILLRRTCNDIFLLRGGMKGIERLLGRACFLTREEAAMELQRMRVEGAA